MGFKCGIVGLPNVGKSTLFNALTSSKNAQAANFPFCTIDPNVGVVDVFDKRLDALSKLSNSKKKINANITFVDIAGLVKGASKGEGLGNKFLSHIREVDSIIHLVRCFDSEKIQHVSKRIDPVNDLETVKTEILLADINQIEKKIQKNKLFVNGPRRIDLDIIFFNKIIIKKNLVLIPHPRAHLRDFVLYPIYDMSPFFRHPLEKKTIKELIYNLKENYIFKKINRRKDSGLIY